MPWQELTVEPQRNLPVNQSTTGSYRYTDAEIDPDNGGVAGTREIPAWAVSLGVHAGVLLLLSTFTYVSGAVDPDNLITSVVDEIDERDYKFDVTVTDIVGNNSDANTLTASKAAAQVVSQNPQKKMQEQLEEEILQVETPPLHDISQPAEADLANMVETMGTSDKTGGVEGSLDRMTYEIQTSLKERQTLVVWLFDESGSLAMRRAEIADRFENVYKQLDGFNNDKRAPLKTAVVGFGENVNFYTPEPIADVNKAVNLVRGMKDDDSGIERVFTAVGQIVQKWGRKFRTPRDKHNCMIVIVTDERGDDYKLNRPGGGFVNVLEDVSNRCSKMGFKVYTIGNASPFGREKGYVRWTWKDGYSEDIAVDQGPESVRMEVLDLPFWGAGGVDSGRISSGLGPYTLTRLCAETGGLYLIAEDARGKQFDPVVMKDYLPDYRPIRLYEEDVAKNKAKQALLIAAESTRASRVRAPTVRFRADTDNALRNEATDAQKPASILHHRVSEIVTLLKAGEKDRARIKEPRWRAAFDLAMGRALALQARADGFNKMLAQMKSSPKSFEKEGNNTWIMRPSAEIGTGPSVRKVAKRAIEYLSRVVDEHQGTPFAYLAELELERQLGWSWVESKVDYAAMGRNNGNNDQNKVLFLEEEDPKTGKKKLVKRERPNL